MKKRLHEKGSLTIETTLAFVTFMLLFFTFLSFGQYTKTQNAVKHSLNQTVLTMSMVNNQRNQIWKLVNSGTGISAGDITNFVAMFDQGAAQDVAAFLGDPYSAEAENFGKEKFQEYKPTQLEKDALKYFTYYMCTDKSWDEINSVQIADDKINDNPLTDMLKQHNIQEFKFNTPEETILATGEKSTNYIRKQGNSSTITMSVTYTINAPFAFTSLFVSDSETSKGLQFTDSQTFVLID